MGFGGAISYVLSNVGKLPQLFSGLSYFKNGGIGKSFGIIRQSTSHFDMRQGQDVVYSGWSMMWWISVINLVLTNLLSIIFNGFTVSNITNILVGGGISLVIYAIFIYKGKENESHWKGWIVKFLIILYLLSIIGYVILIFTNVIAALIGSIGSLLLLGFKYAIHTLLDISVDFIVNITSIFISLYILNGLNFAVISMNNGYNSNTNMGYNPNMQNNYNPNNMMGVSGLGAVNTVKNQSIGQDTTGFNPNQGNGYNQQNNFNQNNGFNQSNMNQDNQNVQMYACPYCGGAITYGTNPCPHCGNQLNWG